MLDCMGGNHVFTVEHPLPGMTCLCGGLTVPIDAARKITTPNLGESVMKEYTKGNIDFLQLPDDPLAIRISIGQPHEAPPGVVDAYCVYRGDRVKVVKLLQRVLASIT